MNTAAQVKSQITDSGTYEIYFRAGWGCMVTHSGTCPRWKDDFVLRNCKVGPRVTARLDALANECETESELIDMIRKNIKPSPRHRNRGVFSEHYDFE